jgi:hypothetical protein
LHEKVFAWMTLADERHLQATWVAGIKRFQAGDAPGRETHDNERKAA